MPLWIVLVLVGAVLPLLGFAGLAPILLLVGAIAAGPSGLVMTIRTLRRRPGPGSTRLRRQPRPGSAEPACSRLGRPRAGCPRGGSAHGSCLAPRDGTPPVVRCRLSPLPTSPSPPSPSTWTSGGHAPPRAALGLGLGGLLVTIAALQAANAMRVISGAGRSPPSLWGRGTADGGPSGARRSGDASARARRVAAVAASPLSPPPGVRCTVLLPFMHGGRDHRASIDVRGKRRCADCIVVADNCTDATVEVALGARRGGGRDRREQWTKAGALNQALAALRPDIAVEVVYLVMDADSTYYAGPPEVALGLLESDPTAGSAGCSSARRRRGGRASSNATSSPGTNGSWAAQRHRLRPDRHGVGLPRLRPRRGREARGSLAPTTARSTTPWR